MSADEKNPLRTRAVELGLSAKDAARLSSEALEVFCTTRENSLSPASPAPVAASLPEDLKRATSVGQVVEILLNAVAESPDLRRALVSLATAVFSNTRPADVVSRARVALAAFEVKP